MVLLLCRHYTHTICAGVFYLPEVDGLMHSSHMSFHSYSLHRINIYRRDAELFVLDGSILYSQEGTTQGDPLAVCTCSAPSHQTGESKPFNRQFKRGMLTMPQQRAVSQICKTGGMHLSPLVPNLATMSIQNTPNNKRESPLNCLLCLWGH